MKDKVVEKIWFQAPEFISLKDADATAVKWSIASND
jgi:hypothetical protein